MTPFGKFFLDPVEFTHRYDFIGSIIYLLYAFILVIIGLKIVRRGLEILK